MIDAITTATILLLSDTAITALVGALAVIVVGLIAATPPSIVAYASLIQSRLNAAANERAVKASVDAAAKAVEKTEMLTEKVVEVHTLTNGNLSTVTRQLEVANVRLEGFANAQAISDERFAELQKQVALISGEHHKLPEGGSEK